MNLSGDAMLEDDGRMRICKDMLIQAEKLAELGKRTVMVAVVMETGEVHLKVYEGELTKAAMAVSQDDEEDSNLRQEMN